MDEVERQRAHRHRGELTDTLRLVISNIGMIGNNLAQRDREGLPGEVLPILEADLARLQLEVTDQAFVVVQRAGLVAEDDDVLYEVLTSAAGALRVGGAAAPPPNLQEHATEAVAVSLMLLRRRRWDSEARAIEAEAQSWLDERQGVIDS